ncbi:MAG: SET domain-containing protein-lysine N-methyltransferase [Opitutales bacterium]|nr:SET domain-containing protein-lysine N-methyltransferase [Opitutales bacterium]
MIVVRHSPIHGNGVFATSAIPAGTRICDYLGEIIDLEEVEHRQKSADGNDIYIMAIDEKYFIDATRLVENNPARFINHSCDENCDAVWDPAEKRLKIIAKRNITPGEELSFDYGFELIDFFKHPCRCGSKNCCGYIVAKPLRGSLFKKLAKHNRAKRSLQISPDKK